MIDTILAWAAAAPVAFLNAVFSAEALAGLAPHRASAPGSGERNDAVILMPAHNEALGIGETLKRLLPLLPSGVRVLVVADNCTDSTAEVARIAGAEVVERFDTERRGKSYALDFGRQHLRAAPPSFVIVLDADCLPEKGAVASLLAETARQGRATQCDNRLMPRPGSAAERISNFAFFLKNSIRQGGLRRIAGTAGLTGTGMAFPWSVFDRAELASGSIVEDLELGVALVREGQAPVFAPAARVWSEPAPKEALMTQRARWEGGFLSTARRRGLPLIGYGVRRASLPALWLGLHLLVPPLALLAMLNLAALLVAGTIALITAADGALYLLLATQIALFAGLAGAWLRGGRDYLSLRSILALPLYVAWKIPLYLKILAGGKREWVRTERR